MEYYSVIKGNTFESVQMRWMDLKPIIWSEVSQKEKDKYLSEDKYLLKKRKINILMHIYRI